MDVNLEEIRPAPDISVVGTNQHGDRAFPLTEVLPAVEQFRRRLSLLRYGHLDDPGARRAQDALTLLWATRGADAVVPQLLERALHLTGADRGNVQLADPDTGALHIAAQIGFCHEFLEYFATVEDDCSACGRAARLRSQTVVTDTLVDPDFRPHSEIADASGFRAVQSTPLVDSNGMLVGVVSTHYPRPGRPPDEDLRALRVYGRLAGEALSQLLVSPTEASADGFEAILPMLAGLESGKTALARLADIAIHRIHAACLGLAATQTDLTDHMLHVRLATAVAELDHALRDLQTAATENAPPLADHEADQSIPRPSTSSNTSQVRVERTPGMSWTRSSTTRRSSVLSRVRTRARMS
jgi:GAF domain-containing protein